MLKRMLAILTLSAPALAVADGDPLPMWQLNGDSNKVYLLGSVHLLREQDYPIPKAIYSAYDDADTLIMELDMDDLDPVATQSLVNQLGLIQDGRTLADLMGRNLYARMERTASEIDLPLQMLAAAEPWLAALTVEQLMLTRVGFDPGFGIEAHLLEKAAADDKPILGLEEMAQQLGFLDSLSMDAQRSMLLQTLEEATEIESMMDDLIDAWRRGDTDFLEDRMLAEMQQYPELYEVIVVARNRDWTRQIEALLDDRKDYLIVVGALHLVGNDSVPSMLDKKGWQIEQMRQPD